MALPCSPCTRNGGSISPTPALNPALELAHDHVADDRHAALTVVEAGDVREILAPRPAENLGVLDGDLFQGLETVGREAGRDDDQVAHAPCRKGLHGGVRIGLEPFGRAEARLE